MASPFAKRILSSYLFSSSSFQNYHHQAILNPLLRLSLSTQIHQQKEVPFIVQYLISSLGFSRERALKVSAYNRLAKINSSSGPESVVQFLKEVGLSDAKIKATISFKPFILSLSVGKILKPNVQQLMAAGFTGEVLVDLIRYNPCILQMRTPICIARLQFWRDFVGDNDTFLKLIQRNGLLITNDIDKFVTPRINLLKEYGFSDEGILKLLTKHKARFLLSNFNTLSQKLRQCQELGFSQHSKLFLYALLLVGSHKKETIEKKSQFFQKMYGWSEEEVHSAFMKFPNILGISEEKVKATMDFLTKSLRLEPRTTALPYIFFTYSLQKRLVPRHHVLSILHRHGLKKDCQLVTACFPSEKTFLEKYIVPYEKDVSGLSEAYLAACSRQVPHIDNCLAT